MAVSEFTIKTGDTSEELSATLNDSVNTSFSLAGATVVFNMRSLTTGIVKINRAVATIVDAATRRVKYSWVSADVNTADDYEAEFEVTLSSGRIITFPNKRSNMLLVHIYDDIA